jgi:hypothetical protein
MASSTGNMENPEPKAPEATVETPAPAPAAPAAEAPKPPAPAPAKVAPVSPKKDVAVNTTGVMSHSEFIIKRDGITPQ